ncbi:MAG: signal peptide peptidase SppA [Bacteroidales bacterium]|nr:signal peptide peptidase SppA [Bacteroidales bacterium]
MKSFFKYLIASILGVFIAGFLLLFVAVGMVAAMLTFSEKPAVVHENALLVMKFDHIIEERTPGGMLSELMSGIYGINRMGLDDILEAIDRAANDERIKGIFLHPDYISAGWGTAEEIRNALQDFKESGKFVVAYGEALSQKAYYIASVADTLALNPAGMLEFRGLSTQVTFYKNALEKLGIDMQIVRHGKFKSAVEPYMLDRMSMENRQQTATYIGGIWQSITGAVSISRHLSVDMLNRLADETAMFRQPEQLRRAGLVDTLLYYDQMLSMLKRLTSIQENKDLRAIDIADYVATLPLTDGKRLAKDKIAVIYAEGDIDMGDTPQSLSSDELARAIRQARRDSSIRAIVLRINSPGGSAYGAEVIWREVQLAAAEKLLIASMGDMAASGGYYIAAAADTIMADHTTVTGSIGIFGMIPNLSGLLGSKLGITHDVVNTNQHSDIINIYRPMNDFEKLQLQQYVESGYEKFITRVADGRGITLQQADAVGQGRVWDAHSAMDNGLIDIYGGVNDAIKLAAEQSGLSQYSIVKLPKIDDPLESWLHNLNAAARIWILRRELGAQFPAYMQLKQVAGFRGAMALMPFDLNIE